MPGQYRNVHTLAALSISETSCDFYEKGRNVLKLFHEERHSTTRDRVTRFLERKSSDNVVDEILRYPMPERKACSSDRSSIFH